MLAPSIQPDSRVLLPLPAPGVSKSFEKGVIYPARALRALGLLLADGAPTVGGGKTF